MPGDKTRDLRKGTRRNFLRKLSAMGVSGAALQYMTKDALAEVTDDPTEEVPRLKGLVVPKEDISKPPRKVERKPVYYTISRDAWARTEAVLNASAEIDRRIREKFNTEMVHTGVGKSNSEMSVIVKYTKQMQTDDGKTVSAEPEVSYQKLVESLPDSVDAEAGEDDYRTVVEDIQVDVEKREVVNHQPCDEHECEPDETHFDYEYESGVPGGCQIQVETGGNCSTATQAWDYDEGNYVQITAGHCTFDTDNEEPDDGVGREVYNPEDGWFVDEDGIVQKVNYVDRDDVGDDMSWPMDAATVNMTNNYSSSYLAGDGSDEYMEYVAGVMAYDRIIDKLRDDEELCRQGRASGRCSGEVAWVLRSWYDFSDCKHFEVDVSRGHGGDSGGAYFELDDTDRALIAGVHRGATETPGVGESLATAMVEIEDRMSLSVPI